MYGRKNRGKRGFRRAVVTLLTFVMLVSTCFPSLVANAAEGTEDATAVESQSQGILGETKTTESQPLTAEEEAEPNGAGSQSPEDGTTSQGTEEQAGSEEPQSQTTEETPESNGTESQNTEDGTKSEGTEEQTESKETEETDQTEGDTVPKETEDDNTEGQQDSAVTELYERLMAASTYDEISEMMEAMTGAEYDLLDQFTEEQAAALTEHIAELREAKPEMLAGPSGGGGQQYVLDMAYYHSDTAVYWDVMEQSTNGEYSAWNGTDSQRVTSVTLGTNSNAVVNANSDVSKGWSNGYTLATYYGNDLDTGGAVRFIPLVITPAAGYYVTKVVVACCGGGSPYKCGTWNANIAFTESFSVGTGGAATIQLPSNAFGHTSGNGNYFILVQVAPIPSPLYVEYDYGIIGEKLGNAFAASAFNDRDAWTASGSGNSYGTGGGVQSEHTQYKYMYSESSEAANWKHYANSITDDAKKAAANVGYYFTGWKVDYYTTCTEAAVTSPAENENNYTYTFSNTYGTATASPGAEVALTTNCRIIAQWAPVELSVKKVVSGLESPFLTAHTYGLTVYYKATKDAAWPETGEEVSLTVTGNGEASAAAISPARPGYYMVKETSGNENLANGSTTMYIAVADGGEVNISQSAIAEGSFTSATLTVTNSYSSATPKIKLVKKWLDANGNELTGEATANLPEVTFYLNNTDGTRFGEATVNYAGGWTTTCEMPENFAGVTEVVPSGYKQSGEIAVSTENDLKNKIVYTVYTATNQQDTTSITVTKQVTGNMGDVNKEFNFTATLSGGTMTPGNYGSYTVEEGGMTITFTLKDNGTVTINNVPIGASLTLKESNVSAYEVMINDSVVKQKDQGGDATSGAISVTSDLTIAVVNKNEALIDTGISMPTFPFILLFSTVAVLGSVYLIGKRRYGEF